LASSICADVNYTAPALEGPLRALASSVLSGFLSSGSTSLS